MTRVNKPIEGDATYWEQIIENVDYDTFFQSSNFDETNDGGTQIHGTEPMPKNYLHFVVWVHDMLWRQEKNDCMFI